MSSNLSLESTFFSNITSWTKNESDNSNSILLYISSSSNLTSSSVNIESISLNPGYIFFSDDAGQIILDGSISSNSVSSILYTAGSSAFQLGYSSGLSVFNNSYGLFATFGGFPSIHIGSVSNTLSASNSWINNRMLVFNDNVDKRSAVSVMNAFLNYASRTSMIWVGNDLAIYLNQTNNSGLLSNAFIQNPVVGEIVVTSIYGGDVFYSAPIPNNWFITETVVITVSNSPGLFPPFASTC